MQTGKPLNIGKEQALEKIKHFCAYQERCHKEVTEKLYSYGLYANQVEELLSELISENYLNEERFAIAFAGGKFRMKDWGRIKIRYELKKNLVSEYCIKKALAQIDATDYVKKAQKLIALKQNSLKAEKNPFVKKNKTKQYLLQKGYELDIILDLLSAP